MALQILKEGQKATIDSSLTIVALALGWDSGILSAGVKGLLGRATSFFQSGGSTNVDCDASVALLDVNKRCIETVSFKRLRSSNYAVWHSGDNLTGEDDGNIKDDEVVFVDLTKLPSDVAYIVPVVNIFNGASKGQHFGMIGNAYVRLVDAGNIDFAASKYNIMKQVSDAPELIHFDLTRKYDGDLAIVVASVYRDRNGFTFEAIGRGTKDRTIEETVSSATQYV